MDENNTTTQGRDPSTEQEEVRFTYVKSNFFRVIHADGAWGGLSPKGNIHMSFYNERGALPDSGILTITSDGKPIKPEEIKTSSQIVREMEVDVIIDLATAISLRRWLDDKINALNDIIKEAQEKQRESNERSKTLKIQR